MMEITILPNEILQSIFAASDPDTWISIMQVCRCWRDIAADYIIRATDDRGQPPSSLWVFISDSWLAAHAVARRIDGSLAPPVPTLAEINAVAKMINEERGVGNVSALPTLRQWFGRIIRCWMRRGEPTSAPIGRDVWNICIGTDVLTMLTVLDEQVALQKAEIKPHPPANYDAETKWLDANVDAMWASITNDHIQIEDIHMSRVEAVEIPPECEKLHPGNDTMCRERGRCILAHIPQAIRRGSPLPARYIRFAVQILLASEVNGRRHILFEMVSAGRSREMIIVIATLLGMRPIDDDDADRCCKIIADVGFLHEKTKKYIDREWAEIMAAAGERQRRRDDVMAEWEDQYEPIGEHHRCGQ